MTSDALRLPPQPVSLEVLRERYAHGGEAGADAVRQRVATALAGAERAAERSAWARRFLDAQRRGFVPAGRIAASAGTGHEATLINCFVQPLTDVRDGPPGLTTALAESAQTLRLGGGVGYDFSCLRPIAARGAAMPEGVSGPVACLGVFDRACEALGLPGSRRGAQMGVLRIDHPDIAAFVRAKDGGSLASFNLSVGVTDAFMQAVHDDRSFELVHAAEPGLSAVAAGAVRREDGRWRYAQVGARALWDQVLRAGFDHGEPGVLFLDTIQRDDNLGWCESLSATNPCGEEPLPPYGSCCLGSFDLTRFVRRPFEADAEFDEAAFANLVPTAVRMLDNVLDLTPWPLPQQREEALATRRIGLGLTGLGDALVMLGLRYDGEAGRAQAVRIAAALRDAPYAASVELAIERGAFARCQPDPMLAGGRFASRLPAPLQARIRAHGLRHSHLLAIAPTGTISIAFCDNASPGIEPAFAWRTARRRVPADGPAGERIVEDHAWRLFRRLRGEAPLPDAFVAALDIAAHDHLAMASALAPFVDAGISKTINLPVHADFEAFRGLYAHAWRSGLKGLTVYRPNAAIAPLLRDAGCPPLGGRGV